MLPKELYQKSGVEEQIASESKVSETEIVGMKIKQIKWGKDGIETIIEGADFPSRGYAPPEAVFANNIVKRLIVKGLPLVNPLRSFHTVIEGFSEISWKIMSPYLLKYEYLMPFTKEIYKLSYSFSVSMGISKGYSVNFATIMAHLFEYDNAYRMRLQDLFTETSKEKLLLSPRAEIRRLLELNRVRENQHGEGVSNKFKLLADVMCLLMMWPKLSQAFKKAISESDYPKLCLDQVDTYWVCHRTDYLYLGKTYEERVTMLEEAGLKLCKEQKYGI